jgi:hypothetical protein
MNLHIIPTVGDLSLLTRAVKSANDCGVWPTLINNGPDPIIIPGVGEVIRPPVPLDWAQSMNLGVLATQSHGGQVMIYQHDDIILRPEVHTAMWKKHDEVKDTRWATIVNYSWQYVIFNLAAFDEIGLFDTNFPNRIYHADVDWSYRARVAGFVEHSVHMPLEHLNGGSNAKNRMNEDAFHMTFLANEDYYRLKWGGGIGEETYKTPFNS